MGARRKEGMKLEEIANTKTGEHKRMKINFDDHGRVYMLNEGTNKCVVYQVWLIFLFG